METSEKSVPSEQVIHYPFFTNIMEANGYQYKGYQRPVDIWKDRYNNTIQICERCGFVIINSKRYSLTPSPVNGYRILINFLYNTKPTNGNKQSNQPTG